MNYRRLGDAGVLVSEIGLGGWLTFGNVIEADAARAVMEKAFDVGINFLDSADAYSGGRCEEIWGEILQPRRRSSFVLATKLYFPMGSGPNDKGLSRKHVMEACHDSLRRLRTDYIDLYQCHRTDENTPLEETIRAMDDLIHQGKILYWGISNWPVEQVEKALQICGNTYYKPKGSQPCYNLLDREPEERLMPLCHKAGIGQVVYSPLAQGMLTGKYRPGQPIPADSRANDSRQNRFITPMVQDHNLLHKIERLVALADETHCTLSQLALAWILRRSEVSCAIIGATKPRQIEENAEASGIQLESETLAKIEEILG